MATMKLDVVGASEAAGILGVEVPRISRWRHAAEKANSSGRKRKAPQMPPTVADLAATPVWRRVDVEKLRDEGEWTGRKPAMLPIAGLSEAADICGVSKRQIGRWRNEGRFPAPTLDKRPLGEAWTPGAGLSSTPLWRRADITRFAAARDKERARRDREAERAAADAAQRGEDRAARLAADAERKRLKRAERAQAAS